MDGDEDGPFLYSKRFPNDHLFAIRESMQSIGFQRENIDLKCLGDRRDPLTRLTAEVRGTSFCRQAHELKICFQMVRPDYTKPLYNRTRKKEPLSSFYPQPGMGRMRVLHQGMQGLCRASAILETN